MARRPPGPMWEVPTRDLPLRGARLRSGRRHTGGSPRIRRSTVAAPRPLGKAHGFLRRLEQCAGLIEALLLFRRGIAVGDNSGARLHIDRAILDERRAQDDAAVHLAVGREVAHAASVGPTLLLLELVDNLHSAYLGGAGERAGR